MRSQHNESPWVCRTQAQKKTLALPQAGDPEVSDCDASLIGKRTAPQHNETSRYDPVTTDGVNGRQMRWLARMPDDAPLNMPTRRDNNRLARKTSQAIIRRPLRAKGEDIV